MFGLGKFRMMGSDMGIDLGTASILVYIKGQGIVLQEPSVVAIEKNTNSILAVGEDARRMLGRTPGNIVAVRPLREGVISDYDITEKMLKAFIEKSIGKPLFIKPRIAVCVPSAVTEVERRAVEDATMQAGARQVFIIEEPISAAIGAGIDISAARGSMLVDIGGGTTDVAVISLGGIVSSTSVNAAGSHMDEAIASYMRRHFNLYIGERTAEEAKINVGTAFDGYDTVGVYHITSMEIRGRCLATGLPKSKVVTSSDIAKAIKEPVENILRAIHGVLEATPPE